MKSKGIIVFILSLLFTSCSLFKEKEPVYTDIPYELKEWLAFQPNSYWIYSDSSSQIEDSIYITNVTEGYMDFGVDGYEEYREYIYITCQSKNIESIISIENSIASNIISIYEWNSILLMKYQISFSYHLYDGFTEGYEFNDVTNLFEKIDILDKTYKNVVYKRRDTYLHNLNSGENIDGYVEIWYAKRIGIIKKRITINGETNTWNLKRYEIIKE